MRVTEKSNNFQSIADASFRFGDFALHPGERLLTRAGVTIPLTPKAFDALLCFVRRAGRLVTKRELLDVLWPSTHVTEANLTNIVGMLRRVLGRDAIATVSKYGYRLTIAVDGEPGIGPDTYQRFVRARELTTHRSIESMTQARELYWLCLAENPSFATGWAWLGRCCWFRAKFSCDSAMDAELAEAAFQRAFALEPDLACAHQFYTPVETDTGRAPEALARLSHRLECHPDEAETLAGLAQVLRFCGLPERSRDAAIRAQELDPTVITSLPHTLFVLGEYAATIESYSGRASYYLDAAAWAALGHPARAATLLRDRLNRTPVSQLMDGLMRSLLAVVEGDRDQALSCMRAIRVDREPEILFYLARHYAHVGESELGITMLKKAMVSGFVPAPSNLRSDPWLESVGGHRDFGAVLQMATSAVVDAGRIFRT